MHRICLTVGAAVLLAACGVTDPDPENGNPDPEPTGFVRGLALSPAGFPASFENLPAFLNEAGSFPQAGVMWNGAWRQDVVEGTDAGTPPDGALLTVTQAGPHGYEPILVFGWRGPAGPHIRIPANPENSWRNQEAAALYIETVARVARDYEPAFLFLGNESDEYFDQDPEDYLRWIGVYNQAYDSVKAASPATRVGPIVQYERTAGIGALAAHNEESWGAVTAHDLGRVDVFGITLYPFFAHATPGAVPDDYLAPLVARIGNIPIAITETGWPAELPEGFSPPWEVSEAHQVTFIAALERILAGLEVPLVTWLYLHPLVPVDEGGLSTLEWNIFHSLSLRRDSGEKRPVYDMWVGFDPGGRENPP